MKRILYYSLVLLASGNGMLQAQNWIHGKVVDKGEQPVDGVAVVLQTLDSTYIDAVVTDSLGTFMLNKEAGRNYRLLFQHLLYEPVCKEISTADAGTIRLTEKDYELEGVVVKAERPQVKVENGALKYDVPQLMKDKAVSNAFEVVKQIPGVIGNDDAVQLLGAGSPSIVINGQLTTMSVDQLVGLLKTIPASRVSNVEIMYNAPAKYNIKGAMINVVLDKETTGNNSLQGEVGADYLQRHYAEGKAHGNLLYSTSRLNVDFLVNGSKGRNYMGEEILARHTLKDQITEINQSGHGIRHGMDGTMRLGVDYTFKNDDKLSAAYYLTAGKSDIERVAATTFQVLRSGQPAEERFSRTYIEGNSALHNVRIQYDGHSGLMAGADFTRYRSPGFQTFIDQSHEETVTDMQNNSKQNISQGALFINHSHTFETGWALNYGVHGGFTSSKTYIDYLYNKGNGYESALDELENNRQKEYSGNAFLEVSKNFGSRFSVTASLKAEYFKSDYTSNGFKSTLWNDWTLFPDATLSYTITPMHILQLNVSSDKTYPSYWDITPQASPINSYSVILGNPSLKPYRSYSGQLLYILKQKYTILAFCDYVPDYFAQLPYQNTLELKNVFRYENMDYQLQFGMGVIVPFRVGEFWNSQVTLLGLRMQEKLDHFHDVSFHNEKYTGQFKMDNTFTLSKSRPNLKLDLNGYFVTGAVQGIYDLGYLYDVSSALKWQFTDDRATLILKCNNIFRSNMPHTMEINQSGQYSRLWKLDDQRCVTVSFVWKFGGYKKKQHEAVDASRFGKSM
ncbi:TonB-dependent receptor domain-containing protein [uncultured Parabacteroides sp.]|uniref:TonB-dependent receptor domain-containing protein n=2 Tax=uncultured Parabacteroides sp. TaxID=512312 RepID=UPI0025DC347F|nr:TonB-dependent receptor [uncultured Parabacteroides sp.]